MESGFPGLCLSLLVELSQLLNNRRTDIDDLSMNTLGAAIGYLIYRLIWRALGKRGGADAYSGWECVLYIMVMFLGRFLLFDEIGFAGRLYGF